MNLKSKKGQTISEYLVLSALVVVGSISVIQLLGSNIQRRLAQVSEAIRGGKMAKVTGQKSSQKNYEVRDMGDFHEAIEEKDSAK